LDDVRGAAGDTFSLNFVETGSIREETADTGSAAAEVARELRGLSCVSALPR
jgi:hypothetical protein